MSKQADKGMKIGTVLDAGPFMGMVPDTQVKLKLKTITPKGEGAVQYTFQATVFGAFIGNYFAVLKDGVLKWQS